MEPQINDRVKIQTDYPDLKQYSGEEGIIVDMFTNPDGKLVYKVQVEDSRKTINLYDEEIEVL